MKCRQCQHGNRRGVKLCAVCGASLRKMQPPHRGLGEFQRRFHSMADTMPVLLWTSGPDLARTFFNKSWLDFTGHTLEQEQDTGWTDGIHPDDRPSCLGAYAAAFDSRAQLRLEYRLKRADGQYRFMLDTGVPRSTPDGVFAGFIGSCIDITEYKEAEARLRSVIENASDVLSVIKPNGIIEYESPSVERLLGWRPEELIGKQVLDYVHADDAASVAEAISRRIAEPMPVNAPTEFRVRARDGSWHVLSAMSRITRDETGTVSLVVNSRDVTEQRMLEEQLRHAQRMESIGELAGGIAHDFNNLLSVILGRTQMLLRELSPDARQRRNLELIEDTARRGAMLTQQLLAFGRKQRLQPTLLNVNLVVAGIVPMLERLIGEQVSIVTRLDSGLGRIRADRTALEQILVNLVVNARDAMPEGGQISLTAENVELDEAFIRGHSAAALGPHVVLAVRDTGTGMDAKTRARIFEPFFTTKGPGRGTGLGLATVHGIVKQHGGYIRVESAPGQGSTFRVYFPRAAETAERAEAIADPVALAPGAQTILLVEDEPEVREIAKNVLEEHGYRVVSAAESREALRIAARHDGPLHLLLTDVVMPDMNGRELADHILGLHPEMKVLFMSGYADEVLGPQGVLEPGIALLPKPFTLSSLTGRVAEVLRG